MNASIIGVGIGCMVAAVIGGGIEVLGIKFPKILSLKRQALLFFLGFIVAIAPLTKEIIGDLPPPKPIVEKAAPLLMAPADSHVFPVEIGAEGIMKVRFARLEQASGVPLKSGEYGLRMMLCQGDDNNCASRQVGAHDELTLHVKEGPASVTLVNFATNPWMRPTLEITYPSHPYFGH